MCGIAGFVTTRPSGTLGMPQLDRMDPQVSGDFKSPAARFELTAHAAMLLVGGRWDTLQIARLCGRRGAIALAQAPLEGCVVKLEGPRNLAIP